MWQCHKQSNIFQHQGSDTIQGRGAGHKPEVTTKSNIMHQDLNMQDSPLSWPKDQQMDDFTLVGPKTKTKQHPPLLHTNMQVSGILLSRDGPKKDLATQTINFGQLIKALITIDPQVLIFPFTCDVEHIQ